MMKHQHQKATKIIKKSESVKVTRKQYLYLSIYVIAFFFVGFYVDMISTDIMINYVTELREGGPVVIEEIVEFGGVSYNPFNHIRLPVYIAWIPRLIQTTLLTLIVLFIPLKIMKINLSTKQLISIVLLSPFFILGFQHFEAGITNFIAMIQVTLTSGI